MRTNNDNDFSTKLVYFIPLKRNLEESEIYELIKDYQDQDCTQT